jgi:hypothetical protein
MTSVPPDIAAAGMAVEQRPSRRPGRRTMRIAHRRRLMTFTADHLLYVLVCVKP